MHNTAPQQTTNNRRFFGHLTKPESDRVIFTLLLFGVVVVASTVWLWQGIAAQEKKLESRVTALNVRLTNVAELKAQRGKESWLEQEARGIFFQIHDRNPETQADFRKVRDIKTQFLQPMLATDSPHDKKYIDALVTDAKPAMEKQYPLYQFSTHLKAWMLFGFLYWAAVFGLYWAGLKPAQGEPAFNVLDLSFIAVLVQFTGGLDSSALSLFLFSLFLAAADFAYGETTTEYQDLMSPDFASCSQSE